MSCPHRVTSGQSNSGHKLRYSVVLCTHVKTLPIFINLSVMSIHETNHFANIKQNIHTQLSDTNFRRVSHFNITPVKRAHKARTCWYRPFRLMYRYQVKEKYKKGMDRYNINFKMLYKCIMANTSAIWQQAAHTTDQLSSPSCSTRAIQKSLTLNKKYLKVFWKKKSGEWTISRKMTRLKEQED